MSVRSLSLAGSNSVVIDIECNMTAGLPNLVMVGLANRAVSESRERLRSSFSSSKLPLPPRRITINLAPADLPKDSPAYDLALAVAILQAQTLISSPPDRTMFFGELGLKGDVKPVRGLIGMLLAAAKQGYQTFYIPLANLRQALLVPNITLVAVTSLSELYMDLSKINPMSRRHTGNGSADVQSSSVASGDFSQVVGQPIAKRALEIAAAGRHHVLLSGPPGTGKSMLAKALPSILPPMNISEILEVSHLHSLASHQYDQLITARPLRSPHHSVSMSALIGGGNRPRPGEVSLAHHGVLFLDELPEFHREAMEALRQPLEDHRIVVARDRDSLTFPAEFILVATANPCPCGNYGSAKPCTCLAYDVIKYQHRISGPLLDRIDLYVEVEEIPHELLLDDSLAEASAVVADRVRSARHYQSLRGQTSSNALLTNQQVKNFARLTPAVTTAFNKTARDMRLSARAYMRVLKVARTIADLDGGKHISHEHLREAIQYRQRAE